MSESRYSLHVAEREPGSGTRTLSVRSYDDSPLPEGVQPTYEVGSTDEVQEVARRLGLDLSRVKFAGGDFEHEAAGEQGGSH